VRSRRRRRGTAAVVPPPWCRRCAAVAVLQPPSPPCRCRAAAPCKGPGTARQQLGWSGAEVAWRWLGGGLEEAAAAQRWRRDGDGLFFVIWLCVRRAEAAASAAHGRAMGGQSGAAGREASAPASGGRVARALATRAIITAIPDVCVWSHGAERACQRACGVRAYAARSWACGEMAHAAAAGVSVARRA